MIQLNDSNQNSTILTGQNCRTMQSEAGVCKPIHDCLNYIDELKITYGPIECFNNIMHCNFSNKGPVICCKRYDMELARTIDTVEELIPIKRKSTLACESFVEKRNNFKQSKLLEFHIIGGKVSGLHLILYLQN